VTIDQLAADPGFDPDANARMLTDPKRPQGRPPKSGVRKPRECLVLGCKCLYPGPNGVCGYCCARVRQARERKVSEFFTSRRGRVVIEQIERARVLAAEIGEVLAALSRSPLPAVADPARPLLAALDRLDAELQAALAGGAAARELAGAALAYLTPAVRVEDLPGPEAVLAEIIGRHAAVGSELYAG
jgi:hypothetical protein